MIDKLSMMNKKLLIFINKYPNQAIKRMYCTIIVGFHNFKNGNKAKKFLGERCAAIDITEIKYQKCGHQTMLRLVVPIVSFFY